MIYFSQLQNNHLKDLGQKQILVTSFNIPQISQQFLIQLIKQKISQPPKSYIKHFFAPSSHVPDILNKLIHIYIFFKLIIIIDEFQAIRVLREQSNNKLVPNSSNFDNSYLFNMLKIKILQFFPSCEFFY
eukprot:TRINITY_DN2584_c0_g6_i2.p4 TRINITY_DN2584_c0_g6~~TRINITY_DN2584_c0_g6_i2.p4  ORF type:complete len:130 (+),score=11.84 TRINITY_DN2584_c0_g6_i2:526-915(+)